MSMPEKTGEEEQPEFVNNTDGGPDDRRLINLACNGDKEAYGRLVTAYQKRLSRFLYMMVGDIDMATDMAQEAFVKAYLSLGSFDRKRPFYPWLATIARNLAINRIKKGGRERPLSDFEGDDRIASVPNGAGNPLDRLLAKESDKKLAEAIRALPEKFRTVFVMRMMEQMSYEQIAAELDISVGTVDSRLFRARDKIMQFLKGYL